MEEIDRTSESYKWKKSLLQRAWRSSTPERASEIIAKIIQYRSWRQTPPEQDEAFLESVAAKREELLDKKLSRKFSDPAERREVMQEIREARSVLKEELRERMRDRDEQDTPQDDPELDQYIQMEREDEEEFRAHLCRQHGFSEETLPEINPVLLRLNALERLRVDRGQQEFPFRWNEESAGDYERLRQSYFRLKKAAPPTPSTH